MERIRLCVKFSMSITLASMLVPAFRYMKGLHKALIGLWRWFRDEIFQYYFTRTVHKFNILLVD